MRLTKARVTNYRSIIDSGMFDVEMDKTILVGPNEAGKTALLQALQQLNAPAEIPGFDALRDYPRSKYNDITIGKVSPSSTSIVEGHFALEEEDIAKLPTGFGSCTYVLVRKLDNSFSHHLKGAPEQVTYGDIRKDLTRLCSHIDDRVPEPPPAADGKPAPAPPPKPGELLTRITGSCTDATLISGTLAEQLRAWLESNLKYVDESNETEEERYDSLRSKAGDQHETVCQILLERVPVFVLFNNYFRVRPNIHLDHLATRLQSNILDDEQYDYGNVCLLKLLGFTARHLSDLGKAPEPAADNADALKKYRDQLDTRNYQLNAASVRLTENITEVWLPQADRPEADRLRVTADGQYLKVVVEDDLGVEIELDQRSEGFQWLVSFFVVFFAEAKDKHDNCVLLLDEPGLNLHGLKQRDFRQTISKLATNNQTLYTTHSPFLVGPDELDLVRVVEMITRGSGTVVHTTLSATDQAALLPLQEALGYDLAQSLFAQQRNLVLEGITDYWYIDATAQLLRESGEADLNQNIALVFAQSAGKVVYYATILHAQKLKVAALLDSDGAGDTAASQETLIHTLGNKAILRTKDVYSGPVASPEIEDLLRETLIECAKSELGWDVTTTARDRPSQPIVDVFADEISEFSKYKLAKAYIRWTRSSDASALTEEEREQWRKLIATINKVLK